ncbi:MAG TPA: GNAT family N-acetyltransferase [Polyangiaceae bacterium]|nr:GNAT family N-acetyltransferase [Polyangiaceae bacterium]
MTKPGATTPPSIRLRPATEADVPYLLALREQTMHQHFVASGVEPTREEHLERVRIRFDSAQIIEHDGHPAGLFKVARDTPAWDLIQIQLAPELQGRGVGERLIRGLLDDAARAGATVSLNVLTANPARKLYERLGFQHVERGDHMYVMRWPG